MYIPKVLILVIILTVFYIQYADEISEQDLDKLEYLPAFLLGTGIFGGIASLFLGNIGWFLGMIIISILIIKEVWENKYENAVTQKLSKEFVLTGKKLFIITIIYMGSVIVLWNLKHESLLYLIIFGGWFYLAAIIVYLITGRKKR